MALQKFEIDLSTIGAARVVVNGTDLSSQVSRVTVDCQAGEPAVPRIYLEGHGLGTISGEGVVIERLDEVENVLGFLDAIDTDRLTREALEGGGLEGEFASPVEAIVATMKRWARGD